MKKKRRRKVKIHRVLILLTPVILLMVAVFFGVNYLFTIMSNDDFNVPEECHFTRESYINFNLELNSQKYILSREKEYGNQIIYAKDIHDKFYPASLTKIMTMHVVLNNLSYDELNEMVIVKYEDVEGLIEANASIYGLNVNDTISVKDALYGLILPSGADCANLLQRVIEEKGLNFIDEMNRLAKEIGMYNTHFSNVTGLFDENNYTTLYDMNLLMSEVYKNDIAKDVLTCLSYEDDGYEFISTMYGFKDYFKTNDAEILGGKTGFTLESHLNIALVMDTKYGKTFLILASADEKGEDGKSAHLKDAISILEKYY